MYTVLQNINNQIKNSIFSTLIIEYSNFSKKKKKILFKWNQIVTIKYKEKILHALVFKHKNLVLQNISNLLKHKQLINKLL